MSFEWPPEIIDAFIEATETTHTTLEQKRAFFIELLTETTRLAVARMFQEQKPLRRAFGDPRSPLGIALIEQVGRHGISLTTKPGRWDPAVTAFYDYASARREELEALFAPKPDA